MTEYKKYEKLNKKFDYDREVVETTADGVRAIHNYINGKNFIEAEILTDDYGF